MKLILSDFQFPSFMFQNLLFSFLPLLKNLPVHPEGRDCSSVVAQLLCKRKIPDSVAILLLKHLEKTSFPVPGELLPLGERNLTDQWSSSWHAKPVYGLNLFSPTFNCVCVWGGATMGLSLSRMQKGFNHIHLILAHSLFATLLLALGQKLQWHQ